jgi:predicted RNA-binding protein (virulence factor B family)
MELGKYQHLKVSRMVEFGAYLTDGKEEVLLPKKYHPSGLKPEDTIEVFVYKDSEDRPVASTLRPKGTVGDLVALKAVASGKNGIFLDWGLEKDLLVPLSEQNRKMLTGHTYLVKILHDTVSDRIYASGKLEPFLTLPTHLEEGEEVEVLIWEFTGMGAKVLVNKAHYGIVYTDDIFRPLQIGENLKGYIRKIRSDGKLDISLRKSGLDNLQQAGKQILSKLRASGGQLPIGDESSPEDIEKALQMSKKTFKRALGMLKKQQMVELQARQITLIEGD